MAEIPIVGLIEEVVLIGEHAAKAVTVKCDTGAKRTSVDVELAHELGMGAPEDEVTVRSSNGVEERCVYPFTVELQGQQHAVLASVTDRSSMSYKAILGRDVLSSYLVYPAEDE